MDKELIERLNTWTQIGAGVNDASFVYAASMMSEAATQGTADNERIAELEASIHQLITAWEILPGSKRYTPREIADWLGGPMKQAMDNNRAILEGKAS